jgi:hypothetical protein
MEMITNSLKDIQIIKEIETTIKMQMLPDKIMRMNGQTAVEQTTTDQTTTNQTTTGQTNTTTNNANQQPQAGTGVNNTQGVPNLPFSNNQQGHHDQKGFGPAVVLKDYPTVSGVQGQSTTNSTTTTSTPSTTTTSTPSTTTTEASTEASTETEASSKN